MAPIYNEGQGSGENGLNSFALLSKEKKSQIIEEIRNPATIYTKQEFKTPNWWVELFRDTLLPKL